MQTDEDKLSRLRQMAIDQGDTWDLSGNDQEAIQYGLDQIEILRKGLNESVKLQSFYAQLLNDYDGGKRRGFETGEVWIARLKEIGKIE
jgi:hypothetical protein